MSTVQAPPQSLQSRSRLRLMRGSNGTGSGPGRQPGSTGAGGQAIAGEGGHSMMAGAGGQAIAGDGGQSMTAGAGGHATTGLGGQMTTGLGGQAKTGAAQQVMGQLTALPIPTAANALMMLARHRP